MCLSESLLDRPGVPSQQERFFRGPFRIVPTDPCVRRHPLRRQANGYCASRGWEIVADYVEPGASATGGQSSSA